MNWLMSRIVPWCGLMIIGMSAAGLQRPSTPFLIAIAAFIVVLSLEPRRQ